MSDKIECRFKLYAVIQPWPFTAMFQFDTTPHERFLRAGRIAQRRLALARSF